MRERTGILVGLLAGAAVGGVAGYLYLTDGGRRLRGQLEPKMDELVAHAVRLRESAARVNEAAQEGFEALRVAAQGQTAPR